MLDAVVRSFLRDCPVKDAMNLLRAVSAFDRFQASDGINAAAELVADAARKAALDSVTVTCYEANGLRQWWSFEAPLAWSPKQARLALGLHRAHPRVLDHSQSPFALATYSCATPASGRRSSLVRFDPVSSDGAMKDAILVMGFDQAVRHDDVARFREAGVAGWLAHAGPNPAARGRIELPPASGMFAFSLTSEELEEALSCAHRHEMAEVRIEIDSTAPMPVVSACIEGHGDDEIWMMAHLCHPRPGANDNASGVAAVWACAALLAAARHKGRLGERHPSMRFFWMPEFCGTASVLADLEARKGSRRPRAVVNLDMVGEDQEQCGCPFIVERSPVQLGWGLSALAEQVVASVFDLTSETRGSWRTSGYLGFSDHSLFADGSVNVPAIQMTHWPDRFNHSSDDSVDKISAAEMRRAITAAAATVCLTSYFLQDPGMFSDDGLCAWRDTERKALHAVAGRYREMAAGAWSEGFLQSTLPDLLDTRPFGTSMQIRYPKCVPGGLQRSWNGPFNARSMIAALSPARRKELLTRIRANKLNLAILNTLALLLDGTRDGQAMQQAVSHAFRRPPDRLSIEPLLGDFIESGWAVVINGPT
ncbi:Aminopeptidase, family M28, containing PA domain [Candidatus Paraburkholderia calva]|nr:Aminopeptidase, family M28, containing PA domain [Candidatus Paraburkholderia calva]